jgi:hypothetical protein
MNLLQPDNETETKIINFSRNYDVVFSTNASNVTFDSHGNEIYGISQLVTIFSQLPERGLILSDPTGMYKKYLEKRFDSLPQNLLILDYSHNFINVIMHSVAMIRATTTDGDSLSIKEALFMGKQVIASDCVSRPAGVILYTAGKQDELMCAIKNIQLNVKLETLDKITDSSLELISLYDEFLKI